MSFYVVDKYAVVGFSDSSRQETARLRTCKPLISVLDGTLTRRRVRELVRLPAARYLVEENSPPNPSKGLTSHEPPERVGVIVVPDGGCALCARPGPVCVPCANRAHAGSHPPVFLLIRVENLKWRESQTRKIRTRIDPQGYS